MEATAAWAQRQVITADRSYIGYIGTYLRRPWQHMDSRPIEGDDGFAYSSLLPRYLIEHVGQGNATIIRSTWEHYRDNGNCGAITSAIDAALPTGSKIGDLFPGYTDANYFLSYIDQNEFRTDPIFGLGIGFRPSGDRPAPLTDQSPSIIGTGHNIDYVGSAYVEIGKNVVPNRGRALNLRVDITILNMPNPLVPVVKIWPVTQAAPPMGSAPVIPPVQFVNNSGLTSNYFATATIPDFDSDQIQWVAVSLSNREMRPSYVSWSYRADMLPVPTATPTPTPMATPTH